MPIPRKIAGAVAAIIAAGSSAGVASAAAPPGAKQCFYNRDVTNYSAADNKTVYIRVGVKDVYSFRLMGPCPDINWTDHLALVSGPGDWICSGLDATLVVPSTIGPRRCPVSDIRKLTAAEIAALPNRAKP